MLCTKLFALSAFALVAANAACAQGVFRLSPGSISKVEDIQDPLKKLRTYHKLFVRDSSKIAKANRKKLKQKLDSLKRLTTQRHNADSLVAGKKNPRSIFSFLGFFQRKRLPDLPISRQSSQLTAVKGELQRTQQSAATYSAVVRDSSVLTHAENRLKGETGFSKYGSYYAKGISADSTSVRTDGKLLNPLQQSNSLTPANPLNQSAELSKLSGHYSESVSPDSISRQEQGQLLKELQQQSSSLESRLQSRQEIAQLKKEIELVKNQQTQYNAQLSQVGDTSKVKEKIKSMSLKNLFNEHDLMDKVQNRMYKLMRKYSSVPNSNDLSTARKQTSLKGRTFRERLVVATNFQVLALRPVTVDLSPVIGYKINSRFSLGTGLTYRASFGNQSNPTVSPQTMGLKAFTSYDVFKGFFGYSEFDRSAILNGESSSSKLTFRNYWLVGLGRRVSVQKKLDMTVTALYNAFAKPGDPIYPHQWMFRIGFQLSDAALLKPKTYVP